MNKFRCFAASLAIAGALGGAVAASAEPTTALTSAVYDPAQPVLLEQAQYLWAGRNYCWYPGGWHGPGWYWCGYAWRRGYGWGGPAGWRGWYWRGGGGGRWHGGGHWRGGGGGHGGHHR